MPGGHQGFWQLTREQLLSLVDRTEGHKHLKRARESTYGLGFLEHGQDEDDIFLPWLQGSVLEVVVVLHVPQDEVGGEGAKPGSNVGLGEVQLSGMTQTSASEPGNVLNELEEAKEHSEP